MVKYSNKTLKLESGSLELPEQIKKVVEVADGYIVLFKTMGKGNSYDEEKDSRNIWKIDPDGSVEWRIKQAHMYAGEYDPFTGLWKEDGEIWAYNYNGNAYPVNIETGELGEPRQLK